jgi:hypothetical protein
VPVYEELTASYGLGLARIKMACDRGA